MIQEAKHYVELHKRAEEGCPYDKAKVARLVTNGLIKGSELTLDWLIAQINSVEGQKLIHDKGSTYLLTDWLKQEYKKLNVEDV